jgi:cysteine synthase
MSKIIGEINHTVRLKAAKLCKEKGITIPTFKQMQHPELIPDEIKDKLKDIGLWDINPLNLFRISWKNDMQTGLYGGVNYIEIPSELTGVKAKIIGIVGKYFPTFGCLIPRMVTGQYDPDNHKAVWPSTGNYCRGGAFDCALLGVHAIAILPEEMSQERFSWLKSIGAEVIATPGCESNVKEIYDKCHELSLDPHNLILNQFDEFGNPLWHYHVTASALEEVYKAIDNPKKQLAGYISATGSAGTIAAGDYLRTKYPHLKVVASEAAECPTLLNNGFGGHRIEGIGDKHIPWVHNVRNTDAVAAIRDEDCMRLLRLFNEPTGIAFLQHLGISAEKANSLNLLGISSIANLLAAIKTAKYYELNENDVLLTIFTDSAEMYSSRLVELTEERGSYTSLQAALDRETCLSAQSYDNFLELSYQDKKRIHNLKYYTWVEQQGKSYEEILEQWKPEYWTDLFENTVEELDVLIGEFNQLIATI